MNAGEFARKLQKCNRNLRVWHPARRDVPSCVVLLVGNEYETMCGFDKNDVPEFTITEPITGRIVKSGWRRTLNILVAKKALDQRTVKRVFGYEITGRQKQVFVLQDDPIKAAEKQAKERGMREAEKKFGVADPNARKLEDLIQIAKMYKKQGRI